MTPWSLAEIAELTIQGEPFDLSLRNFLDGFYLRPSGQSLEREPARLREVMPQMGGVYDAYLAATAESLAREKGLEPPEWVYQENRKLHHPWFALPYASLRAVLLLESPAPFRSRNLFVSENALRRV
jgi:hypothetical protein